ncbi:dimethyl sulfoxide reductase anchor subunit [bacterium]|nr:dimethyl sulfoxide reductase anchor subunit [bacterium]
MRPAFSVIFLTTLIGAGQGLFLALFTVETYGVFGLIPLQERQLYFYGDLIVLALLILGLAASFFHLGRPERAWRAASQWRTSWLSREVIVLPLFMLAVAIHAALFYFAYNILFAVSSGGVALYLSTLVGAFTALIAFVLFLCTAMIYACLPFLREWRSPLTVFNFIFLGAASGFTIAAALATWLAPSATPVLIIWSLILALAGAITRGASLYRNSRLKPKSTLQTALGVKHPNITQLSRGMMGGSFNTREFFHSRDGLLKLLLWLFPAFAFIAPIILLSVAYGEQARGVLLLAASLQYVGLLAERWVFFAQATHPQNLYYQRAS